MTPELRTIITGISAAVGVVVPVVGFISAALTALELLGLTGSKFEPIFDKIDALNVKLDRILAELSGTQSLVYSAWAAGHWRDIAGLLGTISAALDTVHDVIVFHEDVSSPAVIQKLSIVDNESRVAVATLIAGGLDGGYWRRPHFGPALNMAAWEFKTDDRPDVTGDGRVWDYRIALPTLLVAIAARILVIKTLYSASDAYPRLCNEVRTWTRFIGPLIDRIQNNVRKKIGFSESERADTCPGAPTGAFFAGAVDLSNGLDDFIHLDAYGNVARQTYLRKNGLLEDFPSPTSRDRGNQCFGGWVNVEDFAESITLQDVDDGKFHLQHTAILAKQGVFAENRLLWKTPILDLCDFNGVLWELCPKRPPLVEKIRLELSSRRSLTALVVGDAGAKRTVREAFALAAIVSEKETVNDDALLTGGALASLMLGEQTGPAFRTSLREFILLALVPVHGPLPEKSSEDGQ